MRYIGRSVLLGSALATVLLLPAVAAAGKAPSLASTPQYKAFIAYVKELDGLVGQPMPEARKETFETELNVKKEAASHKAKALFKHGRQVARAKAHAKARKQRHAVHGNEEEDLEALAAEYGAKVDRATSTYQERFDRAELARHTFEDRAHEQIGVLRGKKAKSNNQEQKAVIQEHITGLIERIHAKREKVAGTRAELKSAFGRQKEELQSAEAAGEAAIGEEAEATVKKISKHWNRVFDTKKRVLIAKREGRLAYLNSKLEKGRTDIASMPVAG